MCKKIISVILRLSLLFSVISYAESARVKGYYRRNGTYVNPHYRNKTDGYKWNNKNSYQKTSSSSYSPSLNSGNYNPPKKSKSYAPPGVTNYESQNTSGYINKDGTYVAPYFKSKPNSSINDNWSTKDNRNPYTGKKGSKKQESIWE